MPADLLIEGGTLITDPITGEVIEEGFVAIQGNRIAASGSLRDIGDWGQRPREVISGSGHVIMPGIVNAHTHLAAGIFRGILEEGEAGLYNVAFPVEQFLEPEDVYWLGLMGLIEVVKNGCTTINDIYYFASSLALAAKEIGIRAVLAEKMFDADFTQIQHGRYVRSSGQRQEKMRLSSDLVDKWHGANGGLITCRMGTHATDTCSKEMLQECVREAHRLGIGIHIHTAQSASEVELIKSEHGCTPIEYLDSLDYLGPNTICVHCTLNTDSDCDRMAATQTSYAHCPTVYPRRGSYPRLWDFLARGMFTGFGTDWIFMDPWEGMRNAMYWIRGGSGNPNAMPSHEALGFYTSNAAKVLGLETGVLKPGHLADVILVDIQQPHLLPFYNNVAGLVYHATGHDVQTSIVGGTVIMDRRHLLGVNEQDVVREVQKRIPRYRGWIETVAGL